MGTNLKNRYIYGLLFLLCAYIFGITMLSTFDVIKNRQFLQENIYFKSHYFKMELIGYFDNVLTTGCYKDPQKDTNTASKQCLRYYIKNNTNGEIFTNIENPNNAGDYINKNAIYIEKFPKASGYEGELQKINDWFQINNFEGSFIFIKSADGNSQMEKDYAYYNSIKERVTKEAIFGSISLVAGVILFVFLILNLNGESYYIKIKHGYEKIPLDSRAVLFFVYSYFMLIYLDEITFFRLPIGMRHLILLTPVAIYSLFLIVNIHSAVRLLRHKGELAAQLKGSVVNLIILLTHERLGINRTLIGEVLLFAVTVLFGTLSILGLSLSNNTLIQFFPFAYIVIYLVVIFPNILKRTLALNKVIKGTNAIVSGNLDYVIEESGGGYFIKIFRNINNMKGIFKKSVESQVKSERLKTELITNVSHDLKTPLTAIINYVGLLKKGNLSEEQRRKYIDVLEQKSQRLKMLIEDLFEASKVSCGAIELNIEKVDIASLLRQALGEFDEKIINSSLTFKTNIPVEEVYLNLDGKRTWRVLENLISNALKYSQTNSRVYIDVVEQAEKVVITLKNVASYEMDFDVNEIFERFKRGDQARNTEGSGLGLSIAKSIVELQGGQMRIDIDGDLFKVTVTFKK